MSGRFVLMSLEVMLNAAALAFVVGSTAWNQPDGQAMFLLVITLAAAEARGGPARPGRGHATAPWCAPFVGRCVTTVSYLLCDDPSRFPRSRD